MINIRSGKQKNRPLCMIGLFCALLGALSAASCKKESDEDLLVEDEIFATFNSWEESAETVEQVVLQEGFFLDVPDVPSEDNPLFKTYGNFAEDSSYLYFINGAPGTDLGFFTAADKATGELIPLCTKEGCSHSDRFCMACIGNTQSWDILGMGRAGKKLYFAKNSSGTSIVIRSADLTRCEYLDEGTIALADYFDTSGGFHGIRNPSGRFFGGDFYFSMLQQKGDWSGATGEYGIPLEFDYRAVSAVYGFRDKEVSEIISSVYENWNMGSFWTLPDQDHVYSLIHLYRRDTEEEERRSAEGEEDPFIPTESTLILNIWDRESRTEKEVYREEIEFYPSDCALYDGKILMLGRASLDETDTVLAELNLESLKFSEKRILQMDADNEVIDLTCFDADGPVFISMTDVSVPGTKLLRMQIQQMDLSGNAVQTSFSDIELTFSDLPHIQQYLGSDSAYLYFYVWEYDGQNSNKTLWSRLAAVPKNGGQAVIFGE